MVSLVRFCCGASYEFHSTQILNFDAVIFRVFGAAFLDAVERPLVLDVALCFSVDMLA